MGPDAAVVAAPAHEAADHRHVPAGALADNTVLAAMVIVVRATSVRLPQCWTARTVQRRESVTTGTVRRPLTAPRATARRPTWMVPYGLTPSTQAVSVTACRQAHPPPVSCTDRPKRTLSLAAEIRGRRRPRTQTRRERRRAPRATGRCVVCLTITWGAPLCRERRVLSHSAVSLPRIRSYTRQRLTIRPPIASSPRFIEVLVSRMKPASPYFWRPRSAAAKCSM